MIWSDFNTTFLPAAQQTKMAEFEAIALAMRPSGTGTPQVGALTLSQAKAARRKLEEIRDLLVNATRGVEYVVRIKQAEALDALDAANP